jgi:predicted RNA-binding Zn-ribbon protein involved in translation (DUF1610 family)
VTPRFAIVEWLLCPKCGKTCDAPFRPQGSAATEPELWLGVSLPAQQDVPDGPWEIDVAALCPECGYRIVGVAGFRDRLLVSFHAAQQT